MKVTFELLDPKWPRSVAQRSDRGIKSVKHVTWHMIELSLGSRKEDDFVGHRNYRFEARRFVRYCS